MVCLALPSGTRRLHIASRHAAPAELIPASADWHRLGIALTHLRLDDEPVALDDPRFVRGWHDAEPGLRWTDGAGELDLGGAGIVELRLARVPLRYVMLLPRVATAAAVPDRPLPTTRTSQEHPYVARRFGGCVQIAARPAR